MLPNCWKHPLSDSERLKKEILTFPKFLRKTRDTHLLVENLGEEYSNFQDFEEHEDMRKCNINSHSNSKWASKGGRPLFISRQTPLTQSTRGCETKRASVTRRWIFKQVPHCAHCQTFKGLWGSTLLCRLSSRVSRWLGVWTLSMTLQVWFWLP